MHTYSKSLENKYEKLLKNIEIKDCPVLWPPSRPEDFDPTAHKVWDSRKPPGCSDSLRDPRPKAVAGSMAYSFTIASTLMT